jgi:hypothetical protein
MPIQVNAPLDLDSHTREVEVVADPSDASLGTARFLLREIPHGKGKALLARRLSALAAYAEVAPLIEKLGQGAPITEAEADRVGEAIVGVHVAHREIVRWGVADHRGEDFINRGAAVSFVGEEATFLGQRFRVAAPVDLALYERAVDRKPGEPAGPLFGALVRAVELYQEGKIETPAEVWERAKPEAP